MHSSRWFVLVALIALVLCPGLAHAGKGYGFQMWAATTYVSPLSERDRNLSGVTNAVKASSEMGYQFGAELRGGPIGLALDYLHAKHELQGSSGLLGTTDFNPISASLYIHLPTPVVETYIGPTVSYVNWGDLTTSTGTQGVDAKLGYGLTLGADLPLGPALAIGAGLRWLKVDAETDNVPTVAVDPLISRLGLSLRF